MNSGVAGRKQVESALLDYHRAPGKYPLQLRRPEILFASIKEVLLLASGRMPDGAMPPGLAVQRAAGFFVRTALLYPAADHYALLGLERSADASAIKERYRQMMRLMHPDFASSAGGGGNWPADAASRINQAYEVLASDAQRRSYDEQLTPTSAPAPQRPAAQSAARLRASVASAPAPDPRRLLKRMASAFGALAAAALLAILFGGGPDRENLVQRAAAPADPALPAVIQAEVKLASADPPTVMIALADPASPAPDQASTRGPLVAVAAPEKREPQHHITHTVNASPAVTVHPFAAASMPARMLPVSADTAMGPPQMPARPMPVPSALLAQTAPLARAPLAALPANRNVVPNVTMAEAHTLLSMLLQQMETGSGERLLSGLERGARNAPPAQALARQYIGLVDGARSIKIANVQLRGEPLEERLLVKGQVWLEIGDYAAVHTSELALEAEFTRRNGAVVMTRLGGAQASAATNP
jgi:hypothetical protein